MSDPPPVGDGPQGGGVQVVELVSALAAGPNQPRLLEHGPVLGDGLPRRGAARPGGEPSPCRVISRAHSSNNVWPFRSWSSSSRARRVGSARALNTSPTAITIG